MRGSVFACLPLLGIACTKDAADLAVRLDVPLRGTEQAMVVGVEAPGGGALLVRALPIKGSVPPVLTQAFMPSDEDLTVTALLYNRTLGELGLVEGPLEPQVPSDVPARALPIANRIYSAHVTDGMSTSFVPETHVTGLLARVRIREEARPECAAFETHALPLPDEAVVHFALGIGRGALMATDAKQVFFVTYEEGPMRLEGPAIELFDAFASEGRELWLAGEGGQILRGRLEPEDCTESDAVPCTRLATTLATTIPSQEDLLEVSGPPTGDVTDLFALSKTGKIEHFRVESGELDPYTIIPGNLNPGGLAWVGPNEAVVVFYGSVRVYRWKDRATTEEMLEPLMIGYDTAGISTAAFVPHLGAIVGSQAGQVYRSAPSAEVPWQWEYLGTRIHLDPLLHLAGYEAGFVSIDSVGKLEQFVPGGDPSGFCDYYRAASDAPDSPTDVTVVGRDVVAAGAPANNAPQGYVRWLRRL